MQKINFVILRQRALQKTLGQNDEYLKKSYLSYLYEKKKYIFDPLR